MKGPGWAEVAAFEESELALKPLGVCWQLAAATPVAGSTALAALLCCPAFLETYSQHRHTRTPCSTTAEASASGDVVAAATQQQAQASHPPNKGLPQLSTAAVPGTGHETPSHSAPYTGSPAAAAGRSDPSSAGRRDRSEASMQLPTAGPISSNPAPSSSSSTAAGSSSPVQSVLILGASGGVGSFAVLLAKRLFGIPLVLATCSARNAEYVRNLGADVVIDYTSQDVAAAALQSLQQHRQLQPSSNSNSGSSGGHSSTGLDLVIDNVGGRGHMQLACRLLRPSTGLYVTSVPLSNPNSSSFSSVLSFFVHLGARKLLHRIAPGIFPNVAFNGASPDGARLQQLVDFLAAADGVVQASNAEQCLVHLTEFDLSETGAALAVLQTKRVVGKLVLKVNAQL